MRVGVGLPTTEAGVSGALLLAWARRADAGPFSSLGVLDRPRYDSYDPFLALAAAAGTTSRVRLVTMIVVAPLRPLAALAKETASLQALSGGRLVLGLAVGARREDYDAVGAGYGMRARRFVEQLASLPDIWEDAAIVPPAVREQMPPVLVGGLSDQAYARAARFAAGYVHGGGPPRAFARAADRARAAWLDLGRPGQPQLWGQGYFALGEDARDAGAAYLRDYYAFTGPFAEKIVEGILTTPQAVAQFVRGYAEAGCDELILFPAVADLEQLERLADVLASLDPPVAAGAPRGEARA